MSRRSAGDRREFGPGQLRHTHLSGATASPSEHLVKSDILRLPDKLRESPTGMRRGEILAIRWEDVDFERGLVTISRSLGETKQGIFFKEPKTPESRRTIAVPKLTLRILEQHRESQQKEKALMGAAYQDQGLVCAIGDGRPITPDYLSAKFPSIVAKAGLPRMTFHGLRHSQATMLISSGVPVKVVSEMLGHSNTSITQDIYTHVLPNMQRQAADTIDKVLGRPGDN